jgi:replicative DNA helicase
VALRNVLFDDRPGLTVLQIRSRARRVAARMKKEGWPLRLIMVDYIQLLDAGEEGGRKEERRERELAVISKGLKELAKELQLPIMVLAQLNDDAHQRGRLPRKEDLRECKAIAMDADKVVLIWNPAAHTRSHRRPEPGQPFPPEPCSLLVDKNRGGLLGEALAWFFPTWTSFGDMTEAEREDVLRERRETAEAGQRGRRGGR